MSLPWLSFVTTSWSHLISLSTFKLLWYINNSYIQVYVCFKIPVALWIFNPKCFDWHYTVHLVLRSLILSANSIKWLALAIRFAFFFIVFCFFSPFTFDPFYSYKHTEKKNLWCQNLPTSSHCSMNIQNFLEDTCKSVHDSYLYILIRQPNDKEPYFY